METQDKIENQEQITELVKQETEKLLSADRAVQEEEKHLTAFFAGQYGIPQDQIVPTIMETCFPKQNATNAQLMMFMAVCKQYTLNPFIKEIYAFPSNGGITPIVGVDGWNTLINRHPKYKGKEFVYSDKMVDGNSKHKAAHEWIECIIRVEGDDGKIREEKYREYFDEVYTNTGPWNSHTKRMHRHKALIQAARAALGLSGIFDQDEAERIREGSEAPQSNTHHTDMWKSKKDESSDLSNQNEVSDMEAVVCGTAEPEIIDAECEEVDHDQQS